MLSRHSTIRQTFDIVNSCWLFLFLFVVLETNAFVSYFPLSFRNSLWGVALGWILAGARLVYCSGLYGVLIEIASGEEIVFFLAKFKANAWRNLKIYLPVAVAPVVLHFLFFIFKPQDPMSLKVVLFCGDIVFSFAIAWLFIFFKYMKPMALPRRALPVSWQEAGAFFLIFGVDVFLCYWSWPNVGMIREDLIFGILFKYVHLFCFLFLAQIILAAYPEIAGKFQHPRELYLINPVTAGIFTGSAFAAIKAYPAWFSILRALTTPKYAVREFNRAFWNQRYWGSGKLVAISCFSSNSPEAYKIAKGFKARGSAVIMGGPHVTNLPEEALEFCDSVIIGEAEGVWSQVVEDYEHGCLKKKYYAQENEEAFRQVHQYLLQSPPETLCDCLETVRGCKYNCYFCAVPGIGPTCLRRKPVAEVIELVRRIRKRAPVFVFLDNNIYADPKYSSQLFNALRPLHIQWHASSSIDIGQNDVVLWLAKASGCKTLLLGYEITPGSEEQKQGGKFAMAQKYVELTRKIHKAGIGVKAQFIIGFDSDDWQSWIRLWKFCFRIWPKYSSLSILTPFPGTRFFNDVLAENRIKTLNWRNYNCTELVFKPRRIHPLFLGQPFFGLMVVLFLLFPSRVAWVLWVNIFFLFYFGLK